MMKTLNNLLEEEIIICVGSGGVGKTTISAALALQAALLGKKTLALTVDPAKRLATSLGIPSKGQKIEIPEDHFKKAGLTSKGELHVMMVDVKKTFDDLIDKVSLSESIRRNILSNKYYQGISNSLAGSQEYMAMETLLSVYEGGNYELIVLDTPPSRHMLDFLSAPRRLTSVIESSTLRWMFRSYSLMDKLSFGFTKLWMSMALRALERIIGVDVLHDVWEFFKNFESISEQLKRRAERSFELLKSSKSVFLIVTAPRKPTIYDSLYLYRHLRDNGFQVKGIIANKVHLEDDLPDLDMEIKQLLGENIKLAEKLTKSYRNYKSILGSDMLALEELKKSLRDRIPVISIPYLGTEIYDLEKLYELSTYFKSRLEDIILS